MARNPLLELNSVSKRYGKALAVDAVSFELEAEKNLALLGESGSGKTTLLRLIAGFITADQGTIRMNGKVLFDHSTHIAPHKRKVGMVFQDHSLFPHLSVWNNIKFGLPASEGNSVIEALIEMTNLKGLEHRFPKELSGGQQQRVAIARSMAASPGLLLLDEPFSSLDLSVKHQIRDESFRTLKHAGIPSVLVTHDMEDALAFADELLVLHQGRAIQSGKAKDLYNEPINSYVASLFGVINILPSNNSKKIEFFRPHQAKLQEGNMGKFCGIVEKSIFHGRNYLTHVKAEGFTFMIETELPFNTGNEVVVTPDSGTLKSTLL